MIKIIKKLAKNLALKYSRFFVGNKYIHKLVFALLNQSPYIKSRIKQMAINQGIFQPPGNFNLKDYTTPWLDQLGREEIRKMLSFQAKIELDKFYSEISRSNGGPQ